MSVTLGEPREVMNVAEVALYLGFSQSFVRGLMREKMIPYVPIKGRYVFYKPAIDRWLLEDTILPLTDTVGAVAEQAQRIWDSRK